MHDLEYFVEEIATCCGPKCTPGYYRLCSKVVIDIIRGCIRKDVVSRYGIDCGIRIDMRKWGGLQINKVNIYNSKGYADRRWANRCTVYRTYGGNNYRNVGIISGSTDEKFTVDMKNALVNYITDLQKKLDDVTKARGHTIKRLTPDMLLEYSNIHRRFHKIVGVTINTISFSSGAGNKTYTWDGEYYKRNDGNFLLFIDDSAGIYAR